MSKERTHKLKVNDIQYGALLAQDMAAIRGVFGDIEIVKVRQCLGRFSMKIWFKVKGAYNE